MTTRAALSSLDPAELVRSAPRERAALTSTQRSTWWRGMEWSITSLTVLLVTFPVMNSITEAGWVADTPDLRFVGFLALIVAALLAVSPLHWSLGALVSLPVGAVVVVWQVLTTESVKGQPFFFDRFEDLWFRLEDWFTQAFNAGITTDNLPFVLFLVVAAWLLVFFGSFAMLRGRSPWLLLVTMGVMLSINVSYLDGKQWDANFAFFAAGAVLLVMRSSLLRRMERWRADGAQFPDFISLTFLAATVLAVASLMLVTRLLPRPDQSDGLNSVWSEVTSPFGDLSDEFARLFSGIDSARGAPIHAFGDVFVLQGDINPGDQIVLRVDSPEPGLLRGATYDRYTTRGWQQSQTVTALATDGERFDAPGGDGVPYLDRREVTARFSVESSPRALFSFGVPASVDRDVEVQQTAPTVARLDLASPEAAGVPDLQEAIDTFVERSEERALTEAEVLSLIPERYEVVGLENDPESAELAAVVVESRPPEADVVSVRSPEKVRAGFTYQVTGTVSSAGAGALQLAGQDYPLWVRDRFLQLPSDQEGENLARLQDLTVAVVEGFGARTAYDVAVAVETFLAASPLIDDAGNPVFDDEGNVRLRYPFQTDIEPTPIGADAVTWFLLDNVDEDGYPVGGYFDYYASSMAVLLRSVGIPARVSTGYVLGEENFDTRTRTYIVRGRNAFSWVEVFFPEYGWVDFDPTPANTNLEFEGIAGRRAAAQRLRPFTSDVFDDASALVDFNSLEVLLATLNLEDLADVDLGTGRDAGGTSLWLSLGPVIGIAAVGMVGGGGALAWRWSLRGLTPAERSWKSTQRLAGWAGIRAREAETPVEYAGGLGQTIYEPEAATTLAHLYGRVRFGRKALSEADAQEADQAWRTMRGKLLRKVLRLRVRPPDPVEPDG